MDTLPGSWRCNGLALQQLGTGPRPALPDAGCLVAHRSIDGRQVLTSAGDANHKTILIIDDDEVLARALRRHCEDLGWMARVRSDTGKLTASDFSAFDVVILDLMMPNLDGIEILRLLGDCEEKPALIPMSGLGTKLLNSATQLAQFHGIRVLGELHKPFKMDDLAELLPDVEGPTVTAPAQAVAAEEHVFTLGDIEQAIENHEFVVFFQPQVSLSDWRWVGVEALARWRHPRFGLLPPASFLPLVESSKLARSFTFEVLRQAVLGVKVLEREAQFQGKLSVNFPPAGIDVVTIPEQIEKLLTDLDFPNQRLTLEITETSLPQAVKVSLDVQARLALRGISLSIDDFGTGHSSLERLSDSPFSELKIDLMFVSRLEDNESARRIVENAINLGRNLNMAVAAEGVETQGQLRWLKNHGCQIAQGYYIQPPEDVPLVLSWAAQRLPELASSVFLNSPGS